MHFFSARARLGTRASVVAFVAGGLVGVVVACGSDAGSAPEPPTPPPPRGEASIPIDASGGDAGAPRLTVRAIDIERRPVAGALVVFSNADGEPLATATADAAGVAQGEVPDGGQVTVVFRTSPDTTLLTLTGVHPNDELTAVETPPVRNVARDLTPTFAAAPPPGDQSLLLGNCEGPTNASPQLLLLCVDYQPSFTFVANVRDSDAGLKAFSFAKNVVVPSSGAIAIGSGPWSTAVSPRTVTVTNVPDGELVVAASVEVVGATAVKTVSRAGDISRTGTTLTMTLEGRDGYADASQFEVTRVYPAPSMFGRKLSAMVVRHADIQKTAAFDRAAALPELTDTTAQATGDGRFRLSYAPELPITNTTGSYFIASWFVTDEDAGETRTFRWALLAPAGTASPMLPRLAANVALPPGAPSRVDALVFHATDLTYDEVRRDPNRHVPLGALSPFPAYAAFTPALPRPGTFRFSAYLR